MAKDFRLYKERSDFNSVTLVVALATVIEAGDMVTLDAGGLAIKATAASTSLAYAISGSDDASTTVIVVNDPEVSFTGTGDAVFAAANRGAEVDLVVNATNQEIDLGASVTDVFRIYPSEDAGTIGSANEIVVRINKPL